MKIHTIPSNSEDQMVASLPRLKNRNMNQRLTIRAIKLVFGFFAILCSNIVTGQLSGLRCLLPLKQSDNDVVVSSHAIYLSTPETS